MGDFEQSFANWPLLSRLMDEALEVPARARDLWLAQLPDEYGIVKADLVKMLSAASELKGSSFLQALPRAAVDALQQPEAGAGDRIGPWRLVRRIGAGGMASVWMAVRAEGPPGAPVAVKLPHAGWHLEPLAQRLDRERRILETLAHPNIARLLDAGLAANGQPYIVIEYVEGVPIDEYCRGLGVQQRLHLFLAAAGAIAHAHGSLVLHRDVKPGNILVTAEGTVRVLDFGIAKMLEGGEARETELTAIAGRALTPDYASPEQIAGLPLTVASDVYSLGVLLYELISGARPYRLRRETRAALEEAVLEVEPEPPSRRIRDRATRKKVAGDLDTVILKALRKSPAERYATATAFADDVQRYLEGRPVLARPDTARYRFARFVLRNRMTVAASAGMGAALVTGAGAASWQAHVATQEKRRAQETSTFLVSTLLDAHSYRGHGKPLSALDLLREMKNRVDSLRQTDAETRTELLNVLGASLMSLQDTPGSEDVLRKALTHSAALEPGHPQRLRARMLWVWSRIFRGRVQETRAEIDELIGDMEHGGSPLPEDYAAALRARSAAATECGDATVAIQAASEALSVAESKLGPRHNQAVLGLVDLTHAYRAASNEHLAMETGRRAVARALQAYQGSLTHPNTLRARAALAEATGSIEDLRQAAADAAELFGNTSRSAGIDLRSLARMQFRAGETREAVATLRRAEEILRHHFEPGSSGEAQLTELENAVSQAAQEFF